MAIFVLMVGVVGSFGVLPVMIRNQASNTDIFLASQLASEGMELARNIRDKNWLFGQDWKTGLTLCSTGCEIDYNDASFSANLNRFLKTDANNFYNYEAGTNTKFKRKITIQEIGGYLNVKSEVFWNGNGSPFLAEGNFYDWR